MHSANRSLIRSNNTRKKIKPLIISFIADIKNTLDATMLWPVKLQSNGIDFIGVTNKMS